MNRPLLRQACYNVGLVDPISIEVDGTVWLGTSEEPTYPDMTPIMAEYDRLVAQQPTDEVTAKRLLAYQETSDPIFFKWQRGDATELEWREAVAKVKAENPYPPAP